MNFLAKLKSRLAAGIGLSIGSIEVSLLVRKKRTPSVLEKQIALRTAQYLQKDFPELAALQFALTLDNAIPVLDFYYSVIPLSHPPAHGSYLRSMLFRLGNHTDDVALKTKVKLAIARSDLQDGIPERSRILGTPEWEAEADKFELAYGAKIVTTAWPNTSRGNSLLYFFKSHEHLWKGKRVLHFAPEAALKSFFQKQLADKYVTADAFLQNVEMKFDIRNAPLKDSDFDLIICHRVMEHIPNDESGFRELFRLLKTGGSMNFSVPQSPHREQTNEWIYPDESHDCHIRQYGNDLGQRLKNVGFDVRTEDWLLAQNRNTLLLNDAYPLRMYNAQKPKN